MNRLRIILAGIALAAVVTTGSLTAASTGGSPTASSSGTVVGSAPAAPAGGYGH